MAAKVRMASTIPRAGLESNRPGCTTGRVAGRPPATAVPLAEFQLIVHTTTLPVLRLLLAQRDAGLRAHRTGHATAAASAASRQYTVLRRAHV